MESLSVKLNCRTPWDSWASSSVPMCKTLEKCLECDSMKRDKMIFLEQKSIINYTGCLIPCKYREYKDVDGAKTLPGEKG